MLSGWAGLKNGPLVPDDVTKVTPLVQSAGDLHGQAREPRLACFPGRRTALVFCLSERA